jgi:hypothetical protein
MQTVLEVLATRTETRATLQELIARYVIPTAPAEDVGDDNSGQDPGTKPREDAGPSANDPPLHSVSNTAGRLRTVNEGIDDDGDRRRHMPMDQSVTNGR